MQITEKQPHCSSVPPSLVLYKLNVVVVDSVFSNGNGKRIYGPKNCAKASRIEEIATNTLNADSYAEFMTAMYWKYLFQGHLLKPEIDRDLLELPSDIPTQDFELISDNDNNYIDLVAQATQPQLTCAGEPQDKPSTTQGWVTEQISDHCRQLTSQSWIVNSHFRSVWSQRLRCW